ncbi:hypothetical protein V8F06_009028 [Rhypophila decipiens]
MKSAITFTTLIFSVANMASGSKYLDTRTSGDLQSCILRTYVAEDCVGEERNGYIYSPSTQGCRGCGDIQGYWTAFSLQGDCTDGTVFLYGESACAGNSTFVPFDNPGAIETCYMINTLDLVNNTTWVSLQPCFGL